MLAGRQQLAIPHSMISSPFERSSGSLAVGSDQGPAGGRRIDDQSDRIMRWVSRFRRQADDEILLALPELLDEAGNREAAHQLGDVIDVIGVRGDVGRLGPRRAQRLEQDRQIRVDLVRANLAVASPSLSQIRNR